MSTYPSYTPPRHVSRLDRLSRNQQVALLIAGGVCLTVAICCGGSLVLAATESRDGRSGTPTRATPNWSPPPSSSSPSAETSPPSPAPTTKPAGVASPRSSPTAARRTTSAPTASATRTTPPPPANGGLAYYKNCDAARAAGAAPIRFGEPGYRPALDRDHDGTACETD